MIQAVGTLAVILAVSILVIYSGFMLYRKTFARRLPRNTYFELGAAYFLGLIILLALWRMTESLSRRAGFSLCLTILCLAGADLFDWWRAKRAPKEFQLTLKPFRWGLAMTLLAIPALALLFWSEGRPAGWDVLYANVGTQHSPLYAYIGDYIVQTDIIPRVGQNYGQSMLASIPLFVGMNRPDLALYLWLALALVALTWLVYGFLSFSLPRRRAFLGALIVLCGNTALSLFHVVVSDSYSPPLLCGYPDATASLGSYLLLVLLVQTLAPPEDEQSWWQLLTGALFFLSWSFFAPQNIVISLLVLAVVFLIETGQGGRQKSRLGRFVTVCLVAAFLGALQGGMLAPQSRLEHIPESRVGSVKKSAILSPGLYNVFVWQQKYDPPNFCIDSNRLPPIMNIFTEHDYGLWFEIETRLWSVTRIAFFPLLGIGILGLAVLTKKHAADATAWPGMLSYWKWSWMTFGVGFLNAFFLIVDGKKRDLSRFMLPGYLLGMMALALALERLCRDIRPAGRKIIWGALIILACCGPLLHAGTFIRRQLRNGHFLGSLRLMLTLDNQGVLDSLSKL